MESLRGLTWVVLENYSCSFFYFSVLYMEISMNVEQFRKAIEELPTLIQLMGWEHTPRIVFTKVHGGIFGMGLYKIHSNPLMSIGKTLDAICEDMEIDYIIIKSIQFSTLPIEVRVDYLSKWEMQEYGAEAIG